MFEIFAELIVFLFPLTYSLGPGNMFFAANGARFGWRKTLSTRLPPINVLNYLADRTCFFRIGNYFRVLFIIIS